MKLTIKIIQQHNANNLIDVLVCNRSRGHHNRLLTVSVCLEYEGKVYLLSCELIVVRESSTVIYVKQIYCHMLEVLQCKDEFVQEQ